MIIVRRVFLEGGGGVNNSNSLMANYCDRSHTDDTDIKRHAKHVLKVISTLKVRHDGVSLSTHFYQSFSLDIRHMI